MKKIQQLTILAAALLPTYASAADFSYNYAQVSYVSSDFAGADGDGLALDASFALNKDIALIAGYETTSFEEFGDSVDIDILALGFSLHMPLDDQMAAVFNAGFLEADVAIDAPGFFVGSADDTGNFLGAGVRVQANPQMELGLELKRFDAFDDANTGIEASMLFNLNQKNQLGISFSNVSILDEVDNLYFSFRMNF